MKKALGLCAGRHDIPGVENYIFISVEDPTDVDGMYSHVMNVLGAGGHSLDCGDSLDLYVTGLTVALGAVVRYCATWGVSLTLYHYDRESGDYYPQKIM